MSIGPGGHDFLISTYLSCLGTAILPVFPHRISYTFKKSGFFSLFSFLLVVRTEWSLPSSLQAEIKANLKIISNTEPRSVWRRKKERKASSSKCPLKRNLAGVRQV